MYLGNESTAFASHARTIEAVIKVSALGSLSVMTLRLSGRATLINARAASFARRPLQTRQLLTLSSVEGPKDPPLEHRTLPIYFRDEILAKHAERSALVCRQEKPRAHGGPPSRNMGVNTHLAWDFAEFDRHIHALARGLVSLGVQKGDRVAVVMGNTRCALAGSVDRSWSWSAHVITAHMHRYNGRVRAWVRSW